MSLFRKYGESLLGQPIGIEESRVRQQKEGEVKGTLQENKRNQRVARRAYRESMRNKDFGKAMDALDWIDGKAGGMDPGIMSDGTRRGMAENTPGNGLLPPGGANRASGWDQDGNGIPNSIQRPGVASTQPGQTNLQGRLGLFEELKRALASGGDLGSFQGRAAALGISGLGLNAGFERAERELASPDSPAFAGRLAAFGRGKTSLFDRNSFS